MADSFSFIYSQLKKLPSKWGLKFVSDGKKAFIRCPFHGGGKENTPSLLINLRKTGKFYAGNFFCFSCKRFGKSWNNLAPRLNAEGYTFTEEDRPEAVFDEKTEVLLFGKDDNEINLDEMIDWPETDTWRTIKGKLVKAVGGKLFLNPKTEFMQLYLPVMQNGDHLGGIRCNLKKIGKRNYFNTDDLPVKKILYPFDFTKKLIAKNQFSTMVLVEGPRDALRSIQHGIPALAILGSNSWSDYKSELVFSLGSLQKIILAFDPDEAGAKARRTVFDSLKGEFEIRKFAFPEDTDPGNAPPSIMKKLVRACQ